MPYAMSELKLLRWD